MSAVAYNLNPSAGVPRLELLPRIGTGISADRLLYRRRRQFVALVSVMAMTLIAVLALAVTPSTPARQTAVVPNAAATSTEWVVQPGDTLWEIVQTTHPGSDPRPVVTRLTKQRGGVSLQVGERISVPA